MIRDVAKVADTRGMQIQRVGIKGLHLPLKIKRKENGHQEPLTTRNSVTLQQLKRTALRYVLEILVVCQQCAVVPQAGSGDLEIHGACQDSLRRASVA